MPEDPDRIDPRYDPAFQRGYAGGEVRTAPRPATGSGSGVAGAVAARRAPIPEPARTIEPIPPAAPTAPGSVAVAGQAVGAGQTSPEPAAPPVEPGALDLAPARDVTRNPFYLAAAALAVLLVVAGAVWLDQGFAAIADKRWATDVGYYAAMTMSFGAPLLIGIGVAILGALLFVLARAWRPRG